MKAELVFKLDSETKGAVKYTEVDGDGSVREIKDSVVGMLYVRKTALNGLKPPYLRVTLQAE